MSKKIVVMAAFVCAVTLMPGLAWGQTPVACFEYSPAAPADGDTVTALPFDAEGNVVDLSLWTGGIESNFACSTGSAGGFFDNTGALINEDGAFEFVITQAMLDCDRWDFFIFVDGGAYQWQAHIMPYAVEEGLIQFPFGEGVDTVADIFAAGTSCPEQADPTNQGPTEVPSGAPVGGVAGLALLIIAGAAGGACAIRRSSC